MYVYLSRVFAGSEDRCLRMTVSFSLSSALGSWVLGPVVYGNYIGTTRARRVISSGLCDLDQPPIEEKIMRGLDSVVFVGF